MIAVNWILNMNEVLKLKKRILLSLLLPLVTSAASQKYIATADSLTNYSVPEWYQDAKFGIWAHWGVYSVPAYGGTHAAEWYPKHMYDISNANWHYEHHKKTYGPNTEFGYKDFIPMFKAEKFDPGAWMDLAVDSGAKFYTVVAQHCDGFAMYDSAHTKWDVVDMGPKRDICGDLLGAAKKRGLRTGLSNHFACNYFFYDGNHKDGGDVTPETYDLYSNGNGVDEWFLERWRNRSYEMVNKYQPDLLYFDWGVNTDEGFIGQMPEFAAYFYNQAIENGRGTYGAPGVVLNYKGNKWLPKGSVVQDIERGRRDTVGKMTWQTDTSISKHSWSYSVKDDYWSSDELIDTLVDVVSKNGVLMLNFGPKADGTIPEEYSSRLLDIGSWLKVNGEAIYATRPYMIHGEGPTSQKDKTIKELHHDGWQFTSKDIRFTRSKDNKTLYIIALACPDNGELVVKSMAKGKFDAGGIQSISEVGSGFLSKWKQTEDGLKLSLPSKPATEHAHAFRVVFQDQVSSLKL
jgi:alpha-L-fucosidase